MQIPRLNASVCILATAFGLCSGVSLRAQKSRITGHIDNSRRVNLAGHLNPRARPESDQGRVDSSLKLSYVTVALQPSAAQQTDLDQLLLQQQDRASPNYHLWLTPEQYAARFGASQDDIDKIVSWLESQNLQVVYVARGRNAISFSGGVRQVEGAFGTEIHRYKVDGETHYANATEPSVPEAFTGVIGAIHGLNDFRLKPPKRNMIALPKQASAGGVQPSYTSSSFCGNYCLAPGDIATIYDVSPLYSNGINGSGQKIVVVGQTQINNSDIQQFQTYFNLPANIPQSILVPNTQNPGISTDDLGEADLDLEWSDAIARNAAISFVYSYDVTDAVQYAIDQNMAPVLSMSYGQCEPLTDSSDAATLRSWAQQANAQGITWFAASGDAGGADCYGSVSSNSPTNSVLSVDLPGSMPEVTSVGGTEFVEGSGSYWNSTNDPVTHASARSYIPETTWNDSILDGSPAAGGGGASALYTKPSWQTGPGVPNDNARDVPDISISASADHDAYLIFSEGQLQQVGGTSMGAPQFAGVTALLNQYLVSTGIQSVPGVGNLNPRLYALAQSNPGIFHDITTGNNEVDACPRRSTSCTATAVGYSAGVGYDLATGLGSVDIYNLISGWSQGGAIGKSAANVTLASSSGVITAADSILLTATVTGSDGGSPTGTVTFFIAGSAVGSATLNGATASLTLSGSQLAAGANNITAQYSGDYAFSAANASITVNLASSTTMTISGVTNAASFKQVFAPGMIASIFGSNLGPAAQSASGTPLLAQLGGVTATINGTAAPFYFISPGQLNVQIPYSIAGGSTATLKVSYNGQTVSASLPVLAVAPGIFIDSSNGATAGNETATVGQTITLYITGDGAVSPAVTTGSVPAAGTTPKAIQPISLTVGGIPATIAFFGIPTWSVGVTQINYTVPSGLAPGPHPVVVSVGGVPSAAAILTITQ